jgi:imidazolonepropionase-like amidohydrolase
MRRLCAACPFPLTMLFAVMLASSSGQAQATPSVYAIKDARVYPVSGPMIARGTVVIRNGLIQFVGANVSIPPEATVIEGDGLTVYPGLIDSFSDTGIPTPPATGTSNQGQAGAGVGIWPI